MIIQPSWGQNQPSEPSQDTVTGVVSGKDHSTGSSLVAVTGARSPILSNDGSGGRVGSSVSLRVISASSGGRTAQITGFSSSSGAKKVTSSITTRSITNPSALKPECTNSPAPPKKDPPEDDPEEPGKPPQGDGPIPLPIPAPTDEAPSQSNPGCEPTSNTKWFNGSCPPGTQSLGSATLADGSVRSLCKGPVGKPTGCEVPMKWVCDSTIGECIKSTNGVYDSKEACEGAGCKRIRYSCVSGQCVETDGGEFPTYDACMRGGCVNPLTYYYAWRWDHDCSLHDCNIVKSYVQRKSWLEGQTPPPPPVLTGPSTSTVCGNIHNGGYLDGIRFDCPMSWPSWVIVRVWSNGQVEYLDGTPALVL